MDSLFAHSSAIAGAGLGLVVVTWTHYLVAIARETVPRRPRGHSAAMAAGGALGALAVAGPLLRFGAVGAGAVVMLVVNASLVGLYFWLLSQASQPEGALIVSVGDTLASFSSRDDTGEGFESSELFGKRVLLKFFRGHW